MITAPRLLVESPQFQNQRIGVVRAYGGGAEERGQAASAQALMQGADQIADLAFRAAAEDAERQGTEMAQSAARANVMAIDPSTGEPVALSQMGGMGRIGSEAYRRVINTRFQQSIEEEIRNRAAVLAEQYGDDPDGIGLYTTAMSDYISSMSENATGQWRGFIEDTGTSYINRTRAAMTVAQMRASRASMAASGRAAVASAISTREAIVSNIGPAAFGDATAVASTATAANPFSLGVTRSSSGPDLGFSLPTGETSAAAISAATGEVPLSYGDVGIAGAIGLETRVSVSDSIEAGIIDPRAAEALTPAERAADLRGMTVYYTRNLDMSDPDTVRHLSRLRFMIGHGDIIGAMREAPQLAPYMQHLLTDAVAAREFDTWANSRFSDSINLAELESEEAQLEAQAAALELSLQWDQQREDAAYTTTRMFAEMSRAAINPTLDQIITEVSALRSAIPQTRDETVREAMQESIDSVISATQAGLFDNLVSTMPNQDEVDRLRAAFSARNPNLLTPQELPIYRAVERLEPYNTSIFDDFDTEFGSYREGGGRFAQAQAERESRAYVEGEILPVAGNIRLLRGAAIGEATASLLSMLDSAGPMEEGVRNEALRAINGNAAQAELYGAFEFATNAAELSVIRAYADMGVFTEGLPASVVTAVDRASAYMEGNPSGFRTAVSAAAESVNSRLTAEAREREMANGIANAVSGFSNPARAEDREYAQAAFGRAWQRATGSQLPPDALTNPNYLGRLELSEAFNLLYNTPNFMPQFAYDTFSAIGSGAQPQGMEVALAHWQAMRGLNGRNPAINALSEDEIGLLDMMSEVSSYFGGDEQGRVRFSDAITSYNQLRHDPAFRDRVDAYLEKPLDDFLMQDVDGYADLQSDQQQAVRALAGHLISMSSVAPQSGSGPGWIRRRLEGQIAEGTPDTGGVVMEFSPSGGLSSRSRYALSNVVPQAETRFIDYVNQEIERTSDAPLMTTVMGGSIEDLQQRLRSSGGMEVSSYSVLVPYGEDRFGGVSYYVYQMNPMTAEFIPVLHSRGDLQGQPLIISTAERPFRWSESLRARRERLANIQQANDRMELLGTNIFSPPPDIGLPFSLPES